MIALDDPLVVNPPKLRAAYSDRTAWLMAMLSRLAYEHYEKEAWNVRSLAEALLGEGDVHGIERRLAEFRDQVRAPFGEGRLEFEKVLEPGGFTLIDIFDSEGTQGYLALREADRTAALVFRGTEKDFGDIYTDICAWQNAGGAHTGFRVAYDRVKDQVVHALGRLGDCQLYIAGHSLGGALAMMASHHLSKTRRIEIADKIAACYTFGGPKIGNREFTSKIKVPIYRVVHAADIVPWVPINLSQLFAVVAWAGRLIPFRVVTDGLYEWLSRYFNHVHHGDLRLLLGGRADDARVALIPNPTTLEQFLKVIPTLAVNWSRCFEDHAIDRYCEKLERYARGRNPPLESEKPAATRETG